MGFIESSLNLYLSKIKYLKKRNVINLGMDVMIEIGIMEFEREWRGEREGRIWYNFILMKNKFYLKSKI